MSAFLGGQLSPGGIQAQRDVAPLQVFKESSRIVSETIPQPLSPEGRSLGAEEVVLLVLSGVSALLENGFQLWYRQKLEGPRP